MRRLWHVAVCGTTLCVIALCASAARAQDGIQTGDTELRGWAIGGHALNGPTRDDGLWTLGVRYGWVLTKPFLPGPLRGRFEYAVDVMPVTAIYQSDGSAYGAGFDPINLIWDFDTHGRIVPYLEGEGGVLFTDHRVPPPPGNSDVNFATSAAVGAHFFLHKLDFNADVRFLHISNAGLAKPNEGIETIEVRVGVGLYMHHHKK